MPDEKFPPKNDELTVNELERFLQVKIDSSISASELFHLVKNGGWIRFIVDPNFNIILSYKLHKEIIAVNQIDLQDCLLNDGLFELYENVKFEYYDSPTRKTKKIRQAAENKIRAFLKSQGI